MELTRKERWLLYNQFLILQKLYPGQAEHWERACESMAEGFELEYEGFCTHIFQMGLDKKQCEEVRSILAMFAALNQSYTDLGEPADISGQSVRFRGFDPREEGSHGSYARYIWSGGNYPELIDDHSSFQSQTPMLGRYQRMLDVWHHLDSRHNLSKDQLKSIVEA